MILEIIIGIIVAYLLLGFLATATPGAPARMPAHKREWYDRRDAARHAYYAASKAAEAEFNRRRDMWFSAAHHAIRHGLDFTLLPQDYPSIEHSDLFDRSGHFRPAMFVQLSLPPQLQFSPDAILSEDRP